MTLTSNRPARRGEPEQHPPDGALVRLAVGTDGVLAGVPPPPPDSDVSVSLSSHVPAVARALEAAGYRTVGVAPGQPRDTPVADFLVPQAVIEQHPRWWRSLTERADQTFSLAAGPVQAAFAEVLRTHREPLR